MIITNNEEALRIKCEKVLPEEVGELISLLERELANANRLGKGGIGLAAPQIGVAKEIAIIRLGNVNDLNINLVNPIVNAGYDPLVFRQEGCLSFPGRVEDTTRFNEVHITNNYLKSEKLIITGLLGVVCQHEIDHLNSTLFIDHILEKPEIIVNKSKVGPNDPCYCGSGKKYKKCCRG